MTGEPSGDRGDLTGRRPVGSPRSGSKARLRHLSHTARRASGRCLEPCFTVDLDVSTTRPSRGDPCSRPIDRIDEPHVLPHIDGQQVRLVRLTVVTCPVDTHDQSRDRVTPRGVVAPAEKPGHLLGGSSRILQQARAEKLGRSPLTKPLRAASTVDHTVQRCAGPIDARWRASTPARSNIESENQRERSDEARECDKHYPATAESHPRRPRLRKRPIIALRRCEHTLRARREVTITPRRRRPLPKVGPPVRMTRDIRQACRAPSRGGSGGI